MVLHPRGKQVLIAEDDQATRQLIRIVLANEGYLVREAANSIEACDSCLIDPPDLAILDVRMPQRDAWDVMRILKERGMLGGFPIIVLSASLNVREEAEAFDDGVCVIISKPFDIAELLDAVARCLDEAA
ncbi:MAG TPA: response regulator [Thermoanaerobaculia bacterium]|nr:response regulator [Thermoanaerobaculia bacterium]